MNTVKTYVAKQPITLEAVQWYGTTDGISQIKKEFPSIQIIEGTKILPDITYETTVGGLRGLKNLSIPVYFIQQSNGELTELQAGYYIVREYHVYPQEHFEKKYQEVLGDKKS